MSRHYEIVFMVHPDQSEQVPAMIERYKALVENGNSVPLSVNVAHWMQPGDFVRTIAVFNEKNPQPNVATFHLTPRSGRASVATRIRLGDSQRIVAIAQLSDGSFWSDEAEVIVTLPACAES